MKTDERFTVQKIPGKSTHEWLKKKHYAKRVPSISFAYGLFDRKKKLQGVITFGRPIAHTLIQKTFGGEYQDTFMELNRLVVNEGLGKNVLSYFVSQSLKSLPKPMAVVSYADTSQSHHGYIYQATNWFYSGLSSPRKDMYIRGMEHKHGASILDSLGRGVKDRTAKIRKMYGDKAYYKERPRKHRYFFFLGDKKEVKNMKRKMIYEEEPYPKGENKRYDASHRTLDTRRLI